MRLPSPTAVEVGVAAALSSQVVVYLIIESTCVTSRRAFSWTESSYTVGVIWGRPRFRKPRLEPHRPARNRPARSCVAESRVRSEEHTSELQSRSDLVCRLLLEKKKKND